MNDLKLIAGFIVAVLMIGLGLFVLLRRPKPPAPVAEPEMIRPEILDEPVLTPTFTFKVTASTTRVPASTSTTTEAAEVPAVQSADSAQALTSTAVSPETHVITPPAVGESMTLAPVQEETEADVDLLDRHLNQHDRQDETSILAQAERIIALQLLPEADEPFSGLEVLELFRTYGLRFGDMSLFHRYQETDGSGPLMFSVLRVTPEGPQAFDLETLEAEAIEGLWFFLALPGPAPAQGYDTLVSIGQRMAADLDARLCDEHGEVFTAAERAIYRDQILDFIRVHP